MLEDAVKLLQRIFEESVNIIDSLRLLKQVSSLFFGNERFWRPTGGCRHRLPVIRTYSRDKRTSAGGSAGTEMISEMHTADDQVLAILVWKLY